MLYTTMKTAISTEDGLEDPEIGAETSDLRHLRKNLGVRKHRSLRRIEVRRRNEKMRPMRSFAFSVRGRDFGHLLIVRRPRKIQRK